MVGRDPRASGRMIREGVIAGLAACGHDVVSLGIVSTPVLQHTIRRLDAAGGISVGASHNSAEWNALKFFGPRGIYLSTAEAGELLDIYHLRKFDFVEWSRHRGRARGSRTPSTPTSTSWPASTTSTRCAVSRWWWIAATERRR